MKLWVTSSEDLGSSMKFVMTGSGEMRAGTKFWVTLDWQCWRGGALVNSRIWSILGRLRYQKIRSLARVWLVIYGGIVKLLVSNGRVGTSNEALKCRQDGNQ